MTFDALTIAGIVTAVLSGGFVLALAMAEAPSRSAHRRSSPAALAEDTRGLGLGSDARRVRPQLAGRQAKQFRPRTALTTTA